MSGEPERMSRAEHLQFDADPNRWVEGALDSLGERLGRRDRMKARKYIDAGEYRLALEQITQGLYDDDVAITHKERDQLLQLARVMHSDGAASAIDLCSEAPLEPTATRMDAVMRVGRRVGHGVFYVVMAAVFSISVILGVGATKDAADHQSVVWGTFTQEDCLSAYRGCRSIGRWVSDDGTIVKERINLDGSPGQDGTARASYQPSGLVNDNDNNIVHVHTATGMGLWLPWVLGAFAVGSTVYFTRRWKREKALRFEVGSGDE